MKKTLLAAALLFTLSMPIHGREELGAEAQKLGYSIGYQVGGDFRDARLALDVDLLIDGLQRALEGAEPQLSAAEMRAALRWLREATQRPDQSGSDETDAEPVPDSASSG